MSFYSLLVAINSGNIDSFNQYIDPVLVNKVVSDADIALLPPPITYGETPLLIASRFGTMEMIEALVKNGAMVNFHCSKLGSTALIEAAHYGRSEVVDFLIKHDARVDDVDHQQRSALLKAFMFYNDDDALPDMPVTYEAIKKLIEGGANINAQDQDGKTALILAFERGLDDVRAIQLLLDKGINLTLKDNLGKTYMDYLPKAHRDVQSYIQSRFESQRLNDFIDYNDLDSHPLNF